MTRLVISLALILLLAALSAWLVDLPGSVTMTVAGRVVQTSVAGLALLALLLMTVAGGTVWLVGWLRQWTPLIGREAVLKRQRRGLKRLNESLVALAAGDHSLAGRLVEEAEILLPSQPMLHLVAAEAALRSGDHTSAASRYRALSDSADGRLVGLRGLIGEARHQGRAAEALRLAREALRENRKSPWVLETLFELEVAAGEWLSARATLKKRLDMGFVDRDQSARHSGALHFAQAQEARLRGDMATARKGFRASLSERTDFIPAIAALARLDMEESKVSRAEKHLSEAWAKAPHPGLARAWARLDEAESRADWLKRVRRLIARNADHLESRLLLATALTQAGDLEDARGLLDRLTAESPSRRMWSARLALARMAGEPTASFEAAMDGAAQAAVWICGRCGGAMEAWAPSCTHCGGFDTLDWEPALAMQSGLGPRAHTLPQADTITLIAGGAQAAPSDTPTR